MTIGKRLKLFLAAKPENHREIARLMRISERTLYNVLNSKVPTTAFWIKLCKLYPDIDLTYIISGVTLYRSEERSVNKIVLEDTKKYDSAELRQLVLSILSRIDEIDIRLQSLEKSGKNT